MGILKFSGKSKRWFWLYETVVLSLQMLCEDLSLSAPDTDDRFYRLFSLMNMVNVIDYCSIIGKTEFSQLKLHLDCMF